MTTTRPLDGTALSGMTILVVDDEPVVLDVVAEILGLAGAEVLTAVDGAASVEVARRAPRIDVLLVDVLLPDTVADDLVPRLRALVPSASVVLMTGAGARATERLRSEGGIAAELRKPFSLEHLVETVERALDGGGR